MLVDSHCHLNFADFAEDLPTVIQTAHESGIRVMQTICTKMHEFDSIHAITQTYPHIYCSVGVHPHEADNAPLVSVDELVAKARQPKVIGIGETGLDYYYEHSKREAQQLSFRTHIEAARITGLPIIIHTREADADTIAIMRDEMQRGAFKALIHCFTSTHELAEAMLELGAYISISGIITFKSATTLQDTVRRLPLHRLLVETDSPYLAPAPHRGKRNEPAFTQFTCAKLAELQGVSVEECARATTQNFFELFSKVPRADYVN
jgi:TatD DNase family protein